MADDNPQHLHFDSQSQWNMTWSKIQRGDHIKSITFGKRFRMMRSHIKAISLRRSNASLKISKFGDEYADVQSDVDDLHIEHLAACCPGLVEVSFRSAPALTDAAVVALFQYCPRLEVVDISGNRCTKGGITGSALLEFALSKPPVPYLTTLILVDQRISNANISDLFSAWPRLNVRSGKSAAYHFDGPDGKAVYGKGIFWQWKYGTIFGYGRNRMGVDDEAFGYAGYDKGDVCTDIYDEMCAHHDTLFEETQSSGHKFEYEKDITTVISEEIPAESDESDEDDVASLGSDNVVLPSRTTAESAGTQPKKTKEKYAAAQRKKDKQKRRKERRRARQEQLEKHNEDGASNSKNSKKGKKSKKSKKRSGKNVAPST